MGNWSIFPQKWSGLSAHDAFISRNSLLWDAFESGRRVGIILGDSEYPDRKWLFTPYRNPENERQLACHYKQIWTRVLIENAFGRMKRRFAILHSKARLTSHKVLHRLHRFPQHLQRTIKSLAVIQVTWTLKTMEMNMTCLHRSYFLVAPQSIKAQ